MKSSTIRGSWIKIWLHKMYFSSFAELRWNVLLPGLRNLKSILNLIRPSNHKSDPTCDLRPEEFKNQIRLVICGSKNSQINSDLWFVARGIHKSNLTWWFTARRILKSVTIVTRTPCAAASYFRRAARSTPTGQAPHTARRSRRRGTTPHRIAPRLSA